MGGDLPCCFFSQQGTLLFWPAFWVRQTVLCQPSGEALDRREWTYLIIGKWGRPCTVLSRGPCSHTGNGAARPGRGPGRSGWKYNKAFLPFSSFLRLCSAFGWWLSTSLSQCSDKDASERFCLVLDPPVEEWEHGATGSAALLRYPKSVFLYRCFSQSIVSYWKAGIWGFFLFCFVLTVACTFAKYTHLFLQFLTKILSKLQRMLCTHKQMGTDTWL